MYVYSEVGPIVSVDLYSQENMYMIAAKDFVPSNIHF